MDLFATKAGISHGAQHGAAGTDPVQLTIGQISNLQVSLDAQTAAIATKQSKVVISVLDYGADPTGVADSTAAIQAAITAAEASHGVVSIPCGSYKTTAALVVPIGVSLRGAGQGCAALEVTGANGIELEPSIADAFADFDGQEISGLQINGTTAKNFVAIKAYGAADKEDLYRHVRISSVSAKGFAAGAVLRGLWDSTVDGFSTINCWHGLLIVGQDVGVTVKNSDFRGGGGTAPDAGVLDWINVPTLPTVSTGILVDSTNDYNPGAATEYRPESVHIENTLVLSFPTCANYERALYGTIESSTFDYCGSKGISVQLVDGGLGIKDNYIGLAGAVAGAGLYTVARASGNTARGTFSGNTLVDYTGTTPGTIGVFIQDNQHNWRIENNYLSGFTQSDIYVTGSGDTTINDNVSTSAVTGGQGISVNGTTAGVTRVYGNKVATAVYIAPAGQSGDIRLEPPAVSSGTAAPTSTPAAIGDIYVDTTNSKTYIAKGTSSSADWVISQDGGGGGIGYPGAGVAYSPDGLSWGTSYGVGTAANELVQLNGSAQLPAVDGSLLTKVVANGIINVKNCGATGDGTTDDTSFIQACADSVPTGGTLTVPLGTYKLTAPITITNKSMSIVAAGADAPTFLVATGAAGIAITVATAQSVSLKNLVFNGGADGVTISGASYVRRGSIFENLTFNSPTHAGLSIGSTVIGVKFDRIYVNGGGTSQYGIYANSTVPSFLAETSWSNLFVQATTVAGIYMKMDSTATSNYNVTINGADLETNAGSAIYLYQVSALITGAWFEQNGSTGHADIELDGNGTLRTTVSLLNSMFSTPHAGQSNIRVSAAANASHFYARGTYFSAANVLNWNSNTVGSSIILEQSTGSAYPTFTNCPTPTLQPSSSSAANSLVKGGTDGRIAASWMPALTGDVTTSAGAVATTVGKINGVSLAGLGTGLLKNTTATGVPSIAVAGTDYIAPGGNAGGLSAAYIDWTAESGGASILNKPTLGTMAALDNPLTTAGDLWIGGVSGAPARLADVAIGSVLVSGGVGVAPAWSSAPVFSAANLISFPTLNQSTTGNAATATALAANGANCSAGSYPLGVDASGAVEGCTAVPGGGNVTNTGTSTVSQVPRYTDTSGTALAPSTVTIDASGNVVIPGTLTVGDGTVAGALKMSELAANGSNYRNFLVPDALTASLDMLFPDALPSAGDVLTFSAPSAGTSTMAFKGVASANTASAIVARDVSGNFTAGTITAALTGNSSTATALAANGSNCSAGSFPLGVDASGAVETCTAVTSINVTAAQMPALTGDATTSAGAVDVALAAKHKTRIQSFTVFDPVTTDSGRVQVMFPYAITITSVSCSVKAATSATIDFDERAFATPDTSGNAVLTS